MKNLWKKLLAAAIAILMLGAVSAAALDTEAACSLEINLAENVPDELAQADVPVTLYRVADVDGAYNYAPVEAFAALDLDGYKDLDKVADLKEKAAQAAEIAAALPEAEPETEPETEAEPEAEAEAAKDIIPGTAQNGMVSFDGLSTGLYLIVVDTVKAGEHMYSFDPVLVSLPSVVGWSQREENEEGVLVGGEDAEWDGSDEYDVVIDTMKPGTEPVYGDVTIEKTVDGVAAGQIATFIFQVEAVLDGESVFSDVVPISFAAGGTQSATVAGRIPLGASVTVTEVYSGVGYTLTEATEGTLQLGWARNEDGQPVVTDTAVEAVTASFVNEAGDTPNIGSTVENQFTKDGESYNWEAHFDDGRTQTYIY